MEELLHQHGRELLRSFLPSKILPEHKRRGRFLLQVTSSPTEDIVLQDVSRFFWEVLENPAIWQDTLEFSPDDVSVVRVHPSSRDHIHFQDFPKLGSRQQKILVITARLTGGEDIPHRLITRSVHNIAIQPSILEADSNVDLSIVRPGTFVAFEEALRRHGPGYFDIVHLDMHGALDENGL